MRIREEHKQFAKKPTNVSINEGLLREAKAFGVNLSATFEAALEAEVQARLRAQWLLDNREAIEAYNARVERDGTLSERVSAFLAKQGA